MAKELVSPTGGPSCHYHILLTRIKLAKNELEEAEKHCCEALSIDYLNYEAWILWSHIRYLGGDFRGAKERYERVLQFNELPADQTHSIYIRLASIYLKEENVSAEFCDFIL
jgi:tetratricopeptide (TPR) repeat protein